MKASKERDQTKLLEAHGVLEFHHIEAKAGGRDDLVGSDLMDPVIIIVALIIVTVEISIRLL